jgi:hypothetical protein
MKRQASCCDACTTGRVRIGRDMFRPPHRWAGAAIADGCSTPGRTSTSAGREPPTIAPFRRMDAQPLSLELQRHGRPDLRCTRANGAGQLNGPILGTPLPIVAGGIPMCPRPTVRGRRPGRGQRRNRCHRCHGQRPDGGVRHRSTRVCPRCQSGPLPDRPTPGRLLRGARHGRGARLARIQQDIPTLPRLYPRVPSSAHLSYTLPLTTGTVGTPGTGGSLPSAKTRGLAFLSRTTAAGQRAAVPRAPRGSPACATMAPDPSNPEGPQVCVSTKQGVSQTLLAQRSPGPCRASRTRDASIRSVPGGRGLPLRRGLIPLSEDAHGHRTGCDRVLPGNGVLGSRHHARASGTRALMQKHRAEWTTP